MSPVMHGGRRSEEGVDEGEAIRGVEAGNEEDGGAEGDEAEEAPGQELRRREAAPYRQCTRRLELDRFEKSPDRGIDAEERPDPLLERERGRPWCSRKVRPGGRWWSRTGRRDATSWTPLTITLARDGDDGPRRTADHLPGVATARGDEHGDAVSRRQLHRTLHTRFVEAAGEEHQEFLRPDASPRPSRTDRVVDAKRRVARTVAGEAEPPAGLLGEREDAWEEAHARPAEVGAGRPSETDSASRSDPHPRGEDEAHRTR